MLFVYQSSYHIIRSIIALPFLFLLPGYIWTKIVIRRAMGLVEQAVYTLIISMIIIIISGFALHFTWWRIRMENWVILLSSISLMGCAYMLMVADPAPSQTIAVQLRLPRRFYQYLNLILSLILIAGAIAISRNSAREMFATDFTQLWMVPSENPTRSVQIGVANLEREPEIFNLELRAEGKLLKSWSHIELKPNETWVIEIDLPSDLSRVELIEGLLYRQNSSDTVYRRVTLRDNQWKP